ncbi:MAG: DUF624 domain-containing protein [Oscillospiraceae bacterium]|nr:DUF624 domain-containing protein [Oscillospiraceae bacterium]
MGIFSRNFDRPGPGVPKDQPRKKGAARFFELFFRDFGDLIKLNLLFSIVAAPSVILFILGAAPYMLGFYELNFIFLLLSLVLAFPIGGACVAYTYYITKMMRDDPSFVWYEFKRKFKENFKQAAPVGIVCAAFIYMQIIMWFQMYFQIVDGVYTGGLMWFVLALLSFLFYSMITPYIFMHYSYIDLKTFQIIRNSMLMTFAYLPRSFMGGLLGSIIWIIMALQFPNSMLFFPFVVLIFISLSMLLTLTWVWKPFNTHFEVEETLKKRQEEETENIETVL